VLRPQVAVANEPKPDLFPIGRLSRAAGYRSRGFGLDRV